MTAVKTNISTSKGWKVRVSSLLGSGMVYLFVMISLINAILLSYKADAYDPLKITSSHCALQLHVTRSLNVGDDVESQLLLCMCDCDDHTASKLFWQAKENLRLHCEQLLKLKRGLCVEKSQNNITRKNCPRRGFAYCLAEFKAKRRLEVKMVKLIKISIQLVMQNNEIVNVEFGKKQFRYRNRTFQLNGVKCSIPPGYNFLYLKDGNREWMELAQYKKGFPPWLALTEAEKYQKYLRSQITIEDKACSGDKTAFALSAGLQSEIYGQELWPNRFTAYKMINAKTIEAYYHVKPSVKEVTEVMPTPTSILFSTEQARNNVTNLTTITDGSNFTLPNSGYINNLSIEANPHIKENKTQYVEWLLVAFFVVFLICFLANKAGAWKTKCKKDDVTHIRVHPSQNRNGSNESFL